MRHDVAIDADLGNSILELKTDTSLTNGEVVKVGFYTESEVVAGGVILHFASQPQYELSQCTTSRTDIPTTLPTDTNKVWKISLTRTSDIRLVIHCNEVEVLNVLLSDTTCGVGSSWSDAWSRDVEKISFKDDTASDYYRIKGSRGGFNIYKIKFYPRNNKYFKVMQDLFRIWTNTYSLHPITEICCTKQRSS